MKQITEKYIEEKFADIMAEYMEDSDIYKLINKVNEIDKEALPVVLYFIQMFEITNIMNGIVDRLENKDRGFLDELVENEELITKLSNIVEFNNPSLFNKKEESKNADKDKK